MSWWGKVVGGTFGFMLGNYFDGGLTAQSSRLGLGATERVQSAFFTTTFALMGYVAKSDGKVTRDEIAMAERVMSQMRLNAQQREVAVKLFNEGKRQDFPLEEILTQFKRESFRRYSKSLQQQRWPTEPCMRKNEKRSNLSPVNSVSAGLDSMPF
jgi:DnaJ like chaperone protein